MQLMMAGLAGVGFVISLTAAIVVIYSNPREKLNQLFFGCALAIASLNLLDFLMKIANSASRAQAYFYLHFTAWAIFIALLTHFALILARQDKLLNNKLIYYLLYGPAPVFAYLNITTKWFYSGVAMEWWGFSQQFSGFYWVVALYSISYFLGIIYLGWQAWRSEQDRRMRKQKAIILYSFVSTFCLAFVFEVILRLLGWHFPPTITMMPTIIVAFFAYAMIRYGLLVVTPGMLAERIVEIIPDLLVFVDPNRTIVLTNQRINDVLGYTRDELIGQPCHVFHAEKDIHEKYHCLLAEKKHLERQKAVLLAKDGRRIPVNVSAAVIADNFGGEVGSLFIFHDITNEEKLISDQLSSIQELTSVKQKMEGLLKEAAEARDKARLASEELVLKVRELEEFHNVAVGRELKMIEREKEVNALLKELGRGEKYR